MNTFKLKLTFDQRKLAFALVKTVNYGQRGEFDGNRERQYTGILGEIALADLLGLPRPVAKKGYDNGIDFEIAGQKIDLKTMGRTTYVKPYFVNNLIVQQVGQSQTDVYLFASINKTTNEIEFCGYIKKNFLDRKWIKEKSAKRTRADGTTFETGMEIYEVPMSALIPFNRHSFLAEIDMLST